MNIHICITVCIYLRSFLCLFHCRLVSSTIYIYMYMYVCIYIYIYIYIYMYIYIMYIMYNCMPIRTPLSPPVSL